MYELGAHGIEADVDGCFDAVALAPCPCRGVVRERGMQPPPMQLPFGGLEIVAELHEAERKRASAPTLIGVAMGVQLAAQPQLVFDLCVFVETRDL